MTYPYQLIFDSIAKDYLTGSIYYDELIQKYGENTIDNYQFYIHEYGRNKWYDTFKQKKYGYFTTFTLKDPKDKERLYLLVQNIPNRKCLAIEYIKIVKEYWNNPITDPKRPHLHVYIQSKKPIKKTNLKYYARFGQIDHKVITPGTEATVLEYMAKESDYVLFKPE